MAVTPKEEGYKVQVSPEILGDLWNLRANSPEELLELINQLKDEAFVDALNDFKEVNVAKGIKTKSEKSYGGSSSNSGGGTQSSGGGGAKSTPSVGSDGEPVCKHGKLKNLSDKGYKNTHYCPAKNRDEQCPPLNLR